MLKELWLEGFTTSEAAIASGLEKLVASFECFKFPRIKTSTFHWGSGNI